MPQLSSPCGPPTASDRAVRPASAADPARPSRSRRDTCGHRRPSAERPSSLVNMTDPPGSGARCFEQAKHAGPVRLTARPVIALNAGDIVAGRIVNPVRHCLRRHHQPAIVEEYLIVRAVGSDWIMPTIGVVAAHVIGAGHAQTAKPRRQGHVRTRRRGSGRRCRNQQAIAEKQAPDRHMTLPRQDNRRRYAEPG